MMRMCARHDQRRLCRNLCQHACRPVARACSLWTSRQSTHLMLAWCSQHLRVQPTVSMTRDCFVMWTRDTARANLSSTSQVGTLHMHVNEFTRGTCQPQRTCAAPRCHLSRVLSQTRLQVSACVCFSLACRVARCRCARCRQAHTHTHTHTGVAVCCDFEVVPLSIPKCVSQRI